MHGSTPAVAPSARALLLKLHAPLCCRSKDREIEELHAALAERDSKLKAARADALESKMALVAKVGWERGGGDGCLPPC